MKFLWLTPECAGVHDDKKGHHRSLIGRHDDAQKEKKHHPYRDGEVLWNYYGPWSNDILKKKNSKECDEIKTCESSMKNGSKINLKFQVTKLVFTNRTKYRRAKTTQIPMKVINQNLNIKRSKEGQWLAEMAKTELMGRNWMHDKKKRTKQRTNSQMEKEKSEEKLWYVIKFWNFIFLARCLEGQA